MSGAHATPGEGTGLFQVAGWLLRAFSVNFFKTLIVKCSVFNNCKYCISSLKYVHKRTVIEAVKLKYCIANDLPF